MAGNSILEQMLEAATQGGGLKRGSQAGRAGQGGLGDLLGSVLGGGQGSAGGGGGLGDILGGMLGAAPGGRSAGGTGGGLGDILGQVLGGAQGGAGGRSAGGGGLGDILGQVLGGAGARAGGRDTSGGRFNPGMGALEGASLDSGPTPSARTPAFPTQSTSTRPTIPDQSPAPGMPDIVKYGGIAVLGMLAYKALRNWQAGQNADAPAPSGTGFLPQQMPGGGEAFTKVLVQAMIAATQADGIVDEDEQRRLVGQLEKVGAAQEDRQAVADPPAGRPPQSGGGGENA